MKRLTILYALSVCAALSALAATVLAGAGQKISQAERKARDVFMQLNANIIYPNGGRTRLNDGEEVVGLDLWYKKATDKLKFWPIFDGCASRATGYVDFGCKV